MKFKKMLIIIAALGGFTCTSVAFADNTASDTITKAKSMSKMAVYDENLEHKINNVLSAQVPDGSFTVVSYRQKVLLAGQVASDAEKSKALAAVQNTVGVKKVWNYLTVGSNEDAAAISKDAYITSAAKTRLISQKGVNANNIKVVTANKTVYLLGHNAGSPGQLKAAVSGIKQIADVQGVVDLIGQ